MTAPTEATPDRPDAARVEAIRARVEAATKGPWRVEEVARVPNEVGRANGHTSQPHQPVRTIVTEWDHGQTKAPEQITPLWFGPFADPREFVCIRAADAALIAHAPADLAWLLARVERLEGECAEHVESIQQLGQAVAEVTAERDALVADRDYATGECLVRIPEPGSDMSRVIIANLLIRRERDALRDRLDTLVAALWDEVGREGGENDYYLGSIITDVRSALRTAESTTT